MHHNLIVFTGGGTAGHVTPNLALIEPLKDKGFACAYVGSKGSIEEQLVTRAGVPFYSVWSGKLRRYFSWQNFVDPFKLIVGIVQSFFLLGRLKPQVVFSKGGFVAVPVVVGAWLRGIPVVAHESDMTAGLANRLTFPFVADICVTFDKAKEQFNHDKAKLTGTPIRKALFEGDKARALATLHFQEDKPVLLVIGGSLGAERINSVIRHALSELQPNYQIIHVCGKGKLDRALENTVGYRQFEYVDEAMADFLACADLVISRAGANSLYEILALQKLHVLIPLSKRASRGDQIDNARYFEQKGASLVLDDDALDTKVLVQAIDEAFNHKHQYLNTIKALNIQSGTQNVMDVIMQHAHSKP